MTAQHDDPLGPYADIEYFVDPALRHQGIGYLIAKMTVEYATKENWYEKPMIGFVFRIAEDNIPSQEIADKLDMTRSRFMERITPKKNGFRWFKYL